MTATPTDPWSSHTRHTLKRYDEALLRQVVHRLCKPRNQWPVDELLERIEAALNNAAMIDRRLKEVSPECRRLLCVIGRSRQPRWPLGSLVEVMVALGAKDGLAPIVTLLESGLLLPELFPLGTDPDQTKQDGRGRLKNFAPWLARTEPMPMLLASPLVTKRTLGENLGLQIPHVEVAASAVIHEADGLDWPVRVAVLWQQVLAAPLRRTQQGDYFKRDADRLQADPLLCTDPTGALVKVPGPGFFTAALATAIDLLHQDQAELHAGTWPAVWKNALPDLIVALWTALSRINSWNPAVGHAPADGAGNPYPSVYLLALLLLAQLPENAWADPQTIEDWIAARHPYWLGKKTETIGAVTFLLGIAMSLRLLQATKGDAGWLIRLSPLGRWLMGLSEKPPTLASFKQTLLVQPNLELLAYRQGLTPELIVVLSKIATWKTLGPACTLQLEPQSVYRALEMGETMSSIVQLLEGHGMKAIPTAVLDSLKTWSSKRERISIYSAGAIFEFASGAEMNEAIARGLPAVRLTDKLAIVAHEDAIEYKHFRLTGTRDYLLPPEKCVDVEPDGVTLSVDLARSDLLLETELQRFAEPLSVGHAASVPGGSGTLAAYPTAGEARGAAVSGRQQYRLTPASILTARQQGLTLVYLEKWFGQRTGLPISAAAQLLMAGPDASSVALRRQLVLHVGNQHLADGLQQWPGTRDLIIARLGPATLAIAEEKVATLTERLNELGVKVTFEV